MNKSTSVLVLKLRMISKARPLAPSQFSRLDHILKNLIEKPSCLCNTRGPMMKVLSVKSFSKELSCPSSSLLLAFRRHVLAPEINFLVKHHLAACDFCYCELPLLALYTPPRKGECRTPDLPINLRILAESILGQAKSQKDVGASSDGYKVLKSHK